MTLFNRTACGAMLVALIAVIMSGCATTTPGTARDDPARKETNQKKQDDLRTMEEEVQRGRGNTAPAGTIK